MTTIRGAARLALVVSAFAAACGDNDHPGGEQLLVSPQTGLHTTESGGTAVFMVMLTAAPDKDVAVSIVSSNTNEGVVTPTMMTFNARSWNLPQPVTVVGVDDTVPDGNQAYTVRVESDLLGAVDVDVTNDDNDIPGVAVDPTVGLMTTEAGGQATFTAVLTARPAASVTIPVRSLDLTEGTVDQDSLTFTPDNWNAPQTVTITGVDDTIADGPIAYTVELMQTQSADPKFNGLDPDDVQVTNIDNDSPGFFVTPTSGLVTTEAHGTALFTVVLNAQPAADVAIAVTSGDTTEAAVSTPSLTFTTQDWSTPQTVTVTGVDDHIVDGNQPYTIVLAPAVSNDPGYNGLDPDNVMGINLDNDVAGIRVAPTSGLVTSEFGDSDTFTIVLRTQPSADVTIPLASSDLTEGTVSPASVTFTPASWNRSQTITVTGVDDAVVDGNQPYAILTGVATSADPLYNGIDPADVTATNIDNETPQVYVKTRPLLRTSETGTSATFAVRLTVAPASPVVCALHSSDLTEDTVAPASLQFTPGQFGFQTVTVTGVPDGIKDGDQLVTIVLDPCTSADPAYNGQDPRDVRVVNHDIN